MTLNALVMGAGWAGEGHTVALRAAGVEVVALCGRTPEPAHDKARKLAIPNVRFDWREALDEFRPDVVAIATPGGTHREMSEAAARMGCHVVCEKPLATSAGDARAMLLAVEAAGVKHAYAATSRYAPAVLHARSLVADGLIGQVREIESMLHTNYRPLMAYAGWLHEMRQGGGALHSFFTHKIAQVLHITRAEVVAAAGEARVLIDRAPVGPTFHDGRELFGPNAIIDPQKARVGEWRAVDADLGYTVLVRLRTPNGQEASALFQATAMPHPQPAYLALYGSKGTLYLTGPNSPDRIQHFDQARKTWEEVPVPSEVIESLPQVESFVQRDWNQLYREFVSDVRGEGAAGYPSFHEGWVTAEITEIARSGRSWTALPVRPDRGKEGER